MFTFGKIKPIDYTFPGTVFVRTGCYKNENKNFNSQSFLPIKKQPSKDILELQDKNMEKNVPFVATGKNI